MPASWVYHMPKEIDDPKMRAFMKELGADPDDLGELVFGNDLVGILLINDDTTTFEEVEKWLMSKGLCETAAKVLSNCTHNLGKAWVEVCLDHGETMPHFTRLASKE